MAEHRRPGPPGPNALADAKVRRERAELGDNTRLVQGGRRPEWTGGIVNPPVYHASTCVFETMAHFEAAIADPDGGLYYGRRGSPTTWALADALTELEPGAAGTHLFPSGVSAITAALLACLSPGDHLLMVDTTYEPTRLICDGFLKRMSIETTYYDPLIGADIAALMRPNTKAVFTESPGSITFEVQDIPAIVDVAHAHDAMVLLDNTWATPLYFPAIAAGVDMSIHALTKYVVGHSDVMMGAVTTNQRAWPLMKSISSVLGSGPGPDDAYLALRGLRTMGVRLKAQSAAALDIAHWLASHPLVDRVLHPALPDCPGHALWARDFKGASALFAIVLKSADRSGLPAFLDNLQHFSMGFSWGGFESLILAVKPERVRTATPWTDSGIVLRLNIGLEDPADLIADLEAGLARYAAAC